MVYVTALGDAVLVTVVATVEVTVLGAFVGVAT
jgi:hypothetical protein